MLLVSPTTTEKKRRSETTQTKRYCSGFEKDCEERKRKRETQRGVESLSTLPGGYGYKEWKRRVPL